MPGDSMTGYNRQPAGRRRDSRLRTNSQVKFITLGLTGHGQLIDLSQGGAKVKVLHQLRENAALLLHWPEGEAFGQIAWIEGQLCGIRFEDPIDTEVLLETRAGSGAVLLSPVQEIAAEFRARERASRESYWTRDGDSKPRTLALIHLGRFGNRRV